MIEVQIFLVSLVMLGLGFWFGHMHGFISAFDKCKEAWNSEDRQAEVEQMENALLAIGPWMSAALSEGTSCKEYLAAAEEVVEASARLLPDED